MTEMLHPRWATVPDNDGMRMRVIVVDDPERTDLLAVAIPPWFTESLMTSITAEPDYFYPQSMITFNSPRELFEMGETIRSVDVDEHREPVYKPVTMAERSANAWEPTPVVWYWIISQRLMIDHHIVWAVQFTVENKQS